MKLKRKWLWVSSLWMVAVCLLTAPATASPRLLYLGKGGDPFTIRNVARSVKDPRQTFFVPYRGNPVISGPNLYAANPVKAGGVWNVYSGGQFAPPNPHDDIYLATTRDDTLTHGYSGLRKIIDHGVYDHVNDPSAVRLKDGNWVMAMTTKPAGGVDQCSTLISRDGVHWPQLNNRGHEVTISGAHVSLCGRPSLIFNSHYKDKHHPWRWEMYFDGSVNNSPWSQHLAVSYEAFPRHFTYVRLIGLMGDADIKLVNGQYIAAYRKIGRGMDSWWRLRYATSQDGRHFTEHGQLVAPDPLAGYDDCGVTNPGWAINEKGLITAVMYGGTTPCPWGIGKSQLGVALPQAEVTLFSGNIAHTHRQAINATAQRIDTHEYNNVDRIMIRQRPGAPPIINQKIHGTRGDAWAVK
ncbi:hypothetical protein [Streptomyces sp. AK02-04a]|uniref:hypothetical protein n=1 Tax=Streptomyces sp. AK02-04a TaxID=3028649 RepID=UPI0029AC7FCC|nr:hypothetical protein [Streptomyces sp. AK02-04a]MDX3763985.1 hypothetical protein [Streptomyces sp. AK02-04a]